MKKIIYILILILPIAFTGCCIENDLEGTIWEGYYEELNNRYKEVHTLYFFGETYRYVETIYYHDKYGFLQIEEIEETGAYIYDYPDIILLRNSGDEYISMSGNKIYFTSYYGDVITLRMK